MPKVRVSYLGLVQNVLGRQEDEVLLRDGASVRELLHLLEEKHGDAFRHTVLSSDDELRSPAAVLVNELYIGELDGLDTTLTSEAEVSIVVVVYPMEGG